RGGGRGGVGGGVGDQRRGEGEELVVRRRDLVEVAVAAQQRQQLGQVALADARDLDHSSASSPIVSPGGSSCTFSSASSTPGTNASRENVSCRIVSICPSVPKTTSWCATSPGSRTECIGGPGPPHPSGRIPRPHRASFFPRSCSSMTSACGRYSTASRANRIINTAPIAKFGP